MKKMAWILILIAGMLWGCLGLFVRKLNNVGLASMQIVALRASVTCLAMFLYLLIGKRKLLKISPKDIWCFIGTGICSIVFFNFCYFKAIEMTSLSAAAVLLYTAPAFVMVLSYFLFKEKFTKRKLAALVLTFLGCMLVTGVLGTGASITWKGLLFGLGAGLGYALYSIFGRYALNRGYHTLTITFYTFLIAMLGTICLTDYGYIFSTVSSDPELILYSLALGILGTVLPYMTYTIGLKYVENSKAAIIASIEPVTATILGVFVYKEALKIESVIGIVLVILALIISNKKER